MYIFSKHSTIVCQEMVKRVKPLERMETQERLHSMVRTRFRQIEMPDRRPAIVCRAHERRVRRACSPHTLQIERIGQRHSRSKKLKNVIDFEKVSIKTFD